MKHEITGIVSMLTGEAMQPTPVTNKTASGKSLPTTKETPTTGLTNLVKAVKAIKADTLSGQARKLYNAKEWTMLKLFKSGKKKSWSALGFNYTQIKEITSK